jgi:hypothetical protein
VNSIRSLENWVRNFYNFKSENKLDRLKSLI